MRRFTSNHSHCVEFSAGERSVTLEVDLSFVQYRYGADRDGNRWITECEVEDVVFSTPVTCDQGLPIGTVENDEISQKIHEWARSQKPIDY